MDDEMKINLTKYQIRKLRLALYLAAEWEDSLIDSMRVKLKKVGDKIIYVVPKGMKTDANKCKKNIMSFRIIDLILKNEMNNSK